jgi:26S proteasome regulatory subunit N5
MSDGTLFKPERDYTKEADNVIPEAQELAKVFGPWRSMDIC